MKKTVLGCAAAAATMFAAVSILSPAASGQDLPKLSEFLTKCTHDGDSCRTKVKDFVAASVSQHVICLPKDVSISDAVRETLRWVRSDETRPPALSDMPYDDALYEATTKIYPCAPPEPPPPPAEPAPPPAEPAPATPPQQ